MEKVAVIGSNSFSGSHFVDFILEETDAKVIGISRSLEKHPVFLPYKRWKTKRFKFYQMDINKDLNHIIELFDRERPDVIVNFAAQSEVGPSWKKPEQWFRTNCLGIVKLTYKLKDKKYIEKYVQISSPEVYGTCDRIKETNTYYDPSTPYAASKAAGDLFLFVLAKNFGFPLVMIRSTNVYGPHQQLFKIIPRSVIYIKSGRKIPLHGGGKAVKSFIYIRDVCDGIYRAIEKGKIGEIYHFSPPRGYSVRNIVETISKKMGVKFNEVTEVVSERLGQDAMYVIDSRKAKNGLGWRPTTPIDEGIDQIIEWVNSNWKVIAHQPLEYIHKP
ncbi:MAG: GDP-mannose 4,6-dehydratase [Nanoarchaeota archaeon]|nr:GDP-mannose 4,6-dehydratase [Nanoarchaeota archaeon]MCG2719084.1 GDP-mannose 4,6-dehydratase [Nanoarchaeota archaeon]